MIPDTRKIREEIFRGTPRHLVAEAIAKSQPEVRITEKVVDFYLDIAASRQFTIDETVNKIRELDSFKGIFENYKTFVLDDNSEVVISEEMYVKVCESINNTDVLQFMRANKDNFMSVVNILKESDE